MAIILDSGKRKQLKKYNEKVRSSSLSYFQGVGISILRIDRPYEGGILCPFVIICNKKSESVFIIFARCWKVLEGVGM